MNKQVTVRVVAMAAVALLKVNPKPTRIVAVRDFCFGPKGFLAARLAPPTTQSGDRA